MREKFEPLLDQAELQESIIDQQVEMAERKFPNIKPRGCSISQGVNNSGRDKLISEENIG